MAEHRIEDLARLAGTTVRNVRAYQERGLLPPPRREGRIGWYGDDHLARLRVIGALLERGYAIANIAEMLGAWERGSDLRALLGFEGAITSPFVDEAPASIEPNEMAELFGSADMLAFARAVEIGLVEVDGAKLRVPSMRTLRAGAELHRAGMPLVALLDELARLNADMDRIASRLVDLVVVHVIGEHQGAPPAKKLAPLTEVVRRIRPLAEIIVSTQLGRALDRHIRARLGDRIGRLLQRKRA
jgi:DNA-binding transcriptional MerR regulator